MNCNDCEYIRELIQRCRQYEDIQKCLSDWIGETDAEGRYTFVSEGVKDSLGFSPDELIGKKVSNLVIDEDKAEVEKKLFGSWTDRPAKETYLKRMIAKGGEVRVFNTTFVAIRNSAGTVTGFRGINKDITENVRLYEKMKEKSKELDDTQTALRVLVDLKTGQTINEEKNASLFSVQRFLLPLIEKMKNEQGDKREHLLGLMEEYVLSLKVFPSELYMRLTARELEVAQFIIQGYTSKEIGESMGMSARTVENYRQSLRKKLDLRESSCSLRSALIECFQSRKG